MYTKLPELCIVQYYTEWVFIKIYYMSQTLIIGVVYRSLNNNIADVDNCMRFVLEDTAYQHCYMLCDANLDLLKYVLHPATGKFVCIIPTSMTKQRVLMHGHQGWNVRHGLCHIYMIYVYIWVVYSFCLFCCLFIIVTTQFVALYKPCKPKPKPSTYDPRTTTPWQRSKDRYLDRSQSNKYAINMQIQTISVSK